MISYSKLEDGGVFVEQSPREKTLYLDSWMWVKLSREADLRKRFIAAASPRCTIMYSISSLIELALIRDPLQQQGIIEVMESVDFGFIDHDANSVIKRERQFETVPGSGMFSSRHPASDREILDYLVREHYPNAELKMGLLYHQLVSASREEFRNMEEDLASTMSKLLKQLRHEPAARIKARKRRASRKTERAAPPFTQDVLNRFIDYLLVNPTLEMNRNDWMDMMHIIVPVSYLNVVQVDGRWLHFVQNELKLSEPNLAAVYGPNDVERFLREL